MLVVDGPIGCCCHCNYGDTDCYCSCLGPCFDLDLYGWTDDDDDDDVLCLVISQVRSPSSSFALIDVEQLLQHYTPLSLSPSPLFPSHSFFYHHPLHEGFLRKVDESFATPLSPVMMVALPVRRMVWIVFLVVKVDLK